MMFPVSMILACAAFAAADNPADDCARAAESDKLGMMRRPEHETRRQQFVLI